MDDSSESEASSEVYPWQAAPVLLDRKLFRAPLRLAYAKPSRDHHLRSVMASRGLSSLARFSSDAEKTGHIQPSRVVLIFPD